MSVVPTDAPTRTRTYPTWLLLLGVGLLVVVGLAGVAAWRLGDDGPATDVAAVEQLLPTEDSSILRQDPVGIDLSPGHDATLSINGVVVPDDQLDKTPQLNLVRFVPGPGKVIEQLPAGRSCIVATYWRLELGPSEADQRAWCFTAL